MPHPPAAEKANHFPDGGRLHARRCFVTQDEPATAH
jgi:hypothetical protein